MNQMKRMETFILVHIQEKTLLKKDFMVLKNTAKYNAVLISEKLHPVLTTL